MTYYHASQTAELKELRPYCSNHGTLLVYLSQKRENTIVYLSNGIEKYYRENHLSYYGRHYTWASYGFDRNGKQIVEEYYPNALQDTYEGVSGYIYQAAVQEELAAFSEIPGTVISKKPVPVQGCEQIEDAYEELLKLEKQGMVILSRYESHSSEKLEWIRKMIQKEYQEKRAVEDYIRFLEDKFPFLHP